jgi:hypothetical protein
MTRMRLRIVGIVERGSWIRGRAGLCGLPADRDQASVVSEVFSFEASRSAAHRFVITSL